jgi:hypothetical protein
MAFRSSPRHAKTRPGSAPCSSVDIAFFAFLPLGVEHMRIVPGISAISEMS